MHESVLLFQVGCMRGSLHPQILQMLYVALLQVAAACCIAAANLCHIILAYMKTVSVSGLMSVDF